MHWISLVCIDSAYFFWIWSGSWKRRSELDLFCIWVGSLQSELNLRGLGPVDNRLQGGKNPKNSITPYFLNSNAVTIESLFFSTGNLFSWHTSFYLSLQYLKGCASFLFRFKYEWQYVFIQFDCNVEYPVQSSKTFAESSWWRSRYVLPRLTF